MHSRGSGTLSLEEMLNGFDINMHFKGLMEQMDITREDMATWQLLWGTCFFGEEEAPCGPSGSLVVCRIFNHEPLNWDWRK